MSQWHYDGCGCTKDSDYQELDPDGEWCDKCIYNAKDEDLPARLRSDYETKDTTEKLWTNHTDSTNEKKE